MLYHSVVAVAVAVVAVVVVVVVALSTEKKAFLHSCLQSQSAEHLLFANKTSLFAIRLL